MLNSKSKPFLTLFTPTYNRKEELNRLYTSLLSLSIKDFEWLIVDDGSCDGTDIYVKNISKLDNGFEIIYFYQENNGKPSAFNFAIDNANGLFFGVIDSDDTLTTNSLKDLKTFYYQLDFYSKSIITSIIGLCVSPSGEIIGDRYPNNKDLLSWIEISSKKDFGEKWGIHKLEKLINYKYPIFKGEKFIPESYIWDDLGKNKNIVCLNIALRVYYENTENSLSKNIRTLRLNNPQGFKIYYKYKCKSSNSFYLKVNYYIKYFYMSLVINYKNILFK
jgi:glycosyltransferase involved in cell wall biosynthesis